MTTQEQNQLYSDIVDHSKTFSFMNKLTDDEYNDTLSNTFMIVHKNIVKGTVPIERKNNIGYITFVLKNEIYKQLNNRNLRKKEIYKHRVNDNDENAFNDLISPSLISTYETNIKEIIRALPPYKRALLRWNIRGWSPEYMSKKLGYHESTFYQRLTKIKKDVMQQLKTFSS